MLSGDNSILQRTTEAKTRTEKAQIIENAQIDVLGQQAENKGTNITKEQLSTILNQYFETTDPTLIPNEISSTSDMELTTIDKKYKINLSEIFKGKFANDNSSVTFGEKYEDSMIGKTINYTSAINNITDWIILGKQINAQGKNDIIITTKNPVSTLSVNCTLAGWCDYENTLNTACSNYIGTTGTLGTKPADIKEVRSIKLDDINNAVGLILPETFDTYIFGTTQNFANKQVKYYYPDESLKQWVKPTTGNTWEHENNAYYIDFNNIIRYYSVQSGARDLTTENLRKPDNLTYILRGGYFVASRSVEINSEEAYFNGACVSQIDGVGGCIYSHDISFAFSDATGGEDEGYGAWASLRPVVVLSSEVLWNDVKDLIGNYATYN